MQKISLAVSSNTLRITILAPDVCINHEIQSQKCMVCRFIVKYHVRSVTTLNCPYSPLIVLQKNQL